MDLTKLQSEITNLEVTIKKYNSLINDIKLKIKNNLKEISKYEKYIKNTNNEIEISIYNCLMQTITNENKFLKELIVEEARKNA